jgi:hypothetical protein
MEGVAPNTPECSGAGGVKLTLVDEHGTVVSASPEFVCDGPMGVPGPQGVPGPTGPAGTGFGFRQVFIGSTTIPAVGTTGSIGSISTTVTTPGIAWVVWTGQCIVNAGSSFRFEIGTVANAAVPNTTAAVTVVASSPISVSRTFTLTPVGAGSTFILFVNGERTAGAGTASCFGGLTLFFTPGTQLAP